MKSLQSRIVVLFVALIAIVMIATSGFVQSDVNRTVYDLELLRAKNVRDQLFHSIQYEYQNSEFHREALYRERREFLESVSSLAFGVIQDGYSKYQSGELSEEEAIERTLETVQNMRYDNGVGYVWINDTTHPVPKMIMHPTIPSLNGHILDSQQYNCVEGRQKNLFVEAVDVCLEKGDGYVNYLWPKPTNNGLSPDQPKISYVRLFKPWNWVIGTGVYTDDIERECKKHQDKVFKALFKEISTVRIAHSGYFYIFDGEGKFLVHPQLAGTNGNNLKNPVTGSSVLKDLSNAAKHPDKPFEYVWGKPGDPSNNFQKVALVRYFAPLDWYIGVSPYLNELTAPAKELRFKILWSSLIFLILAGIAAWWVARNISKPLTLLAKASRQIEAKGARGVQLPISGTLETQTLGHCLQTMIDSLQKNQERLETMLFLVESAASAIAMGGMDGKLTYVNPAFLNIWGYDNKEEVIGRSLSDFWKISNSEENIIHTLKNQGRLLEEIAIRSDGTLFPVQVSAAIVRNDKGAPIAIMSSSQDITEQKTAQDDLKKARNYISNIINSMPSVLIGVDAGGVITQWNDGAIKETDITQENAIGKPLLEVFPRLSNEVLLLKEAIASRRQQHDIRRGIIRNGEQRYEDSTVFPLVANGVQGAVIRIDDGSK
ncbi:MAG: cache domain-containing protein [Deltaproteobacteria bacterium]|nr:cache domain-containing protein [Deltaproteobacteria bacterium]